MRALHRTVVVGAFGGLAVATAAGSMAFACSPINGLQLLDAAGKQTTSPRFNPGEAVNVKILNFTNAGEKRQLEDRNDPRGTEVTVGPVEIVWFPTEPSVGRIIGTESAGSAIRQVIIPEDISSGTPSFIVVRQRSIVDGSVVATDDEPLYSKSGPPPSANVDTKPPALNQPATALPTPTPAVRPSTPTARTPGAPARQAPVAGSVAAPAPAPAPAATPAPATATVAGQPAVVTGIAAPVGPLAPALAEPAGQQAPSDLWTGLSSERLPSLLDSPQAPASSGVPMGAVLFGTGVLTLVGAALALGGRRLAVVRRITSRR